MKIDVSKSVILTSSLNERVLHQLESSMDIEMRNFESGIKYLGFVLKENSYFYEDWLWLVKKLQNHIASWSHRWLSRGGRSVLIKFVLNSIPVILDYYFKNPKRNFKQGEKKFLSIPMERK
jgi:hypothetical protein